MSKLIVIEGMDGSGKTTAAEVVARRYGASHMDSMPPLYRQHQKAFYDALGHDGWYMHMMGMLTLLKQDIRQQLLEGHTVVLTRYWHTTTAYYRAKCRMEGKTPLNFQPTSLGLPKPDAAVMLTVNEEERHRRLNARAELSAEDEKTMNRQFQRILEQEYRRFPDLAWLDTTGKDPDNVADMIQGVIEARQIDTSVPAL